MALDFPGITRASLGMLDFAAGGGIVAIACALAGAASVEASEIDPLALAAIGLNAAANGVGCHPATMGDSPPAPQPAMTGRGPAAISLAGDVVGTACRWDLILCGDVCYEAPMTAHIMPWLTAMAAVAEVWIADPGRAYLPKIGLAPFATYSVETTLELEDRTVRDVVLYRLLGGRLAGGAD